MISLSHFTAEFEEELREIKAGYAKFKALPLGEAPDLQPAIDAFKGHTLGRKNEEELPANVSNAPPSHLHSLILPSRHQVRYVEALMRLSTLGELSNADTSTGAGLTVVDSGAASAFMTPAYSEKAMGKLKTSISSLEIKLHIQQGQRWKPEDQEFKTSLAQLRDIRCER